MLLLYHMTRKICQFNVYCSCLKWMIGPFHPLRMRSIFENGNGEVRTRSKTQNITWLWLPLFTNNITEGVAVPEKKKTVASPPSTPKQEIKSAGSSPSSSRKNSIDEVKDVSSQPPLQPVRARRISTIVNDKEKDPKEVLQSIDAALYQAETSEELVDM